MSSETEKARYIPFQQIPTFIFPFLLDVLLEVLALNQIRDIVLIIVLLVLPAFALLHLLIAFGELAQRRKAVGAELVENAGNELGQLLLLAVTVEGERVGRDRGVDCFGAGRWGAIESALRYHNKGLLSNTESAHSDPISQNQ